MPKCSVVSDMLEVEEALCMKPCELRRTVRPTDDSPGLVVLVILSGMPATSNSTCLPGSAAAAAAAGAVRVGVVERRRRGMYSGRSLARRASTNDARVDRRFVSSTDPTTQ